MSIRVRILCRAELAGNTGKGAGKGFHYFYDTGAFLADAENVQACPDHPSAEIEHVVVEYDEE